MAWTSPRTWVTGEIVTAAIMNTHVRDDLLETAPAKATAAGDLFIGTGANAIKRLAKGTARQVPQVNAGATDIEWAASPQSVLTGEADLLYASAANVLARLAKGTTLQALIMNAGATAPSWAASLQSLLTAAGAIIIASGANTPAELAKGSARQALVMNAGGTLPEWADVFLKLIGGTMTGPITMNTDTVGHITLQTVAIDGSVNVALNLIKTATKGWAIGNKTIGGLHKFTINTDTDLAGVDAFTIEPDGSAASINGNTVWTAGNDGAGSTLDADTTDTYHANNTASNIPVLTAGGALQAPGGVGASGTWADTTTAVTANSTYTKQIALGYAATKGRLIARGSSFASGSVTIYDGAIVWFGTNSANTHALIQAQNVDGTVITKFINGADLRYITTHEADPSNLQFGDDIYLKTVSINGTNLDIVFDNTDNDTNKTLNVSLYWEVD